MLYFTSPLWPFWHSALFLLISSLISISSVCFLLTKLARGGIFVRLLFLTSLVIVICTCRNLVKISTTGPELLLNVQVMGWRQISSTCAIRRAVEHLCNIILFHIWFSQEQNSFICLSSDICVVNLIQFLVSILMLLFHFYILGNFRLFRFWILNSISQCTYYIITYYIHYLCRELGQCW